MKKIFLTLFLSVFAMPVFAVCSIDGKSCSISSLGNTNKSLLEQKTNFNPLDEIKQPNSLLQQNSQQKNMETNTIKKTAPNYDANCQFGVCLPKDGKQIKILDAE